MFAPLRRLGTSEHIAENREALDLRLDAEDLTALDLAFPLPSHELPLEVH
jgi:diketogulonate reductase-like aldo/keto reductase